MNCIFLTVVNRLLHFDGVKLLLEASLLKVGHEYRQVVSGPSKGRRLSGLTWLNL